MGGSSYTVIAVPKSSLTFTDDYFFHDPPFARISFLLASFRFPIPFREVSSEVVRPKWTFCTCTHSPESSLLSRYGESKFLRECAVRKYNIRIWELLKHSDSWYLFSLSLQSSLHGTPIMHIVLNSILQAKLHSVK